jgi:hypothetical protein
MANPAFSNSPAFAAGAKAVDYSKPISAEELDAMYGRPSASPVETDRMSYEDTIVKTLIAFGVLVATAAVGWFVPGARQHLQEAALAWPDPRLRSG